MAGKQIIRIRLKGTDHRLIDQSVRMIVDIVVQTGDQLRGPIPLPTKNEYSTALTSPSVRKETNDKHDVRIYKRLMDIISPTGETMIALTNLTLTAGVDIQIENLLLPDMHCISRDNERRLLTMSRWYAGFRCVGKPNVVLDQISTKIRNDNLGRFIPRICFERSARKEFYLFVAIESQEPGILPPELRELLSFSFLGSPIRDSRTRRLHIFNREDIRRLVGTEVNVEDYTRHIQYHRLKIPALEDPFAPFSNAFAQFSDAHDHINKKEQSKYYNYLLHWLSAVGSGSLANFQGACLTLGLIPDGIESRRILRRLRLLGHLECSRDGTRWFIAPPVLTRRCHPVGDDAYVLCGARDSALLEAIRLRASVEEVPQPEAEAPATLYTRSSDPTKLASVHDTVFQFQIADNAAERLADIFLPIELWPDTLQLLAGITPHMFDIKRFDGYEFVDEAFSGKTGLYELWPPVVEKGQQTHSPRYTLFYDSKQDRWLRGDWYGLRFLTLCLEGKLCQVQYDQEEGRLAVPEKQRWPELYERALVLASGRLPTHCEGWLIYEAISARLLDALRGKLHLKF